jgi:Fe-S cluster assembly iron-binding protein IscA
MAIELTPEAAEVLKRSLELGGVGAGGGIRLRAARALGGGVDVQVELAAGPEAGETTVERAGVRLFIDPEVLRAVPDPVVTLEPQHETVVVRPRGATP